MKTIQELLQAREEKPKSKKGGINSKRSYVVGNLIEFMRENLQGRYETPEQLKARLNTRMKYWLGRTRNQTPEDIERMMSQAKTGKNPQKLFNWLLKKHNEKLKDERKTIPK